MSVLSLSTDLSALINALSRVDVSFFKLEIFVFNSSQFCNCSCFSISLSTSRCSSSSIPLCNFIIFSFLVDSHALCFSCKLFIVSPILSLLCCCAVIFAFSSTIASFVCLIFSFKFSAFSESIVIPNSCSIMSF